MVLSATPVSLCGGLLNEHGAVLMDNNNNNNNNSDNDVACNFDLPVKPNLNRFQTFETAQTETNSSLDSASVRDDKDLDAFGLDDSGSMHGSLSKYSGLTDTDLLKELEEAVDFEKQIVVLRILKEMEKRNLHLKDRKRQADLQKAAHQTYEVLEAHMQNPEANGWKRQTMIHGRKRDTVVYHRMNDEQEVTVMMQTPIEASLLVPLLAILNETDLYTTWLPSFQRPFKLGMRSVEKLQQMSRGAQVARARVDMPWPMVNREVVAKNILAEAVDEMGAIAIRMKTMEAGEGVTGFTTPPTEEGWLRIGMDAGLVFRKCPADHPTLKRHAHKHRDNNKEPLLLATFTLTITPAKNMILKTVSPTLWTTLISFAENVQKGKAAARHQEAIHNKQELYGWVEDVVERMTHKCS